MASETGAGQGPEEAPAQPTHRPLSRRRKKKLAILLFVVAAALVVLFWGWSSTGKEYMTVGQLIDQTSASVPEKYAGKYIEIKGVVTGWDGTPGDLDFTLVDEQDSSKSLTVTVNGTLPEGFENLKSVVVKGVLAPDLPLRIAASEITVGCASKY